MCLREKLLLACTIFSSLPCCLAQQHRPPAVPLAANDPYFSLWSMADALTDAPTKHWSESAQPITGLARIDGHTYRWMGASIRHFRLPVEDAMQQLSVEVTPLHSKYRFAGAGVELQATFFTPLFPQDLEVMSRPITYLAWSVVATDGKAHKVDLLLDVDPVIGVNDPSQQVTWSRSHTNGLTILSTGSRDQAYLNRSGDRVRIDWGYFHLAVPDSANPTTEMSTDAMAQFEENGNLSDSDDLSMPRPANSTAGSGAHRNRRRCRRLGRSLE